MPAKHAQQLSDIETSDAESAEGSGAVSIPIHLLRSGYSPRVEGEDLEHVRRLAESEEPLPPILVHRTNMRIIDGMHRFRAAKLRGLDSVTVEYFDGTDDAAFLLAVKRNAIHGLPLTPADRHSAVRRALEAHPDWADRTIASVLGVSAKTVGSVRRGLPGAASQAEVRRGRDGRTRPLNTAKGRLRASELIAAEPDISLRTVASRAGISVGTAQDVRLRLRRGENPVPNRDGRNNAADHAAAVTNVMKDPSLRHNETGRLLLRMVDAHPTSTQQWRHLAEAIPTHWLHVFAALAADFADGWRIISSRVEQRRAEDPGN